MLATVRATVRTGVARIVAELRRQRPRGLTAAHEHILLWTDDFSAGDDCFGLRMRVLIVLLWRPSLRISEAFTRETQLIRLKPRSTALGSVARAASM